MDPRCVELDRLIESIAGGDIDPGPAQAAHLARCRRCASALALARQLDRALALPPPHAPPGFPSSVQRRLRGEWWKAERHLDRWFNIAIAAGLTLIAGGFYLLLNVSGLGVVLADVSALLLAGGRPVLERATSQLPLYGGAGALLLTALGVWWWAEAEP